MRNYFYTLKKPAFKKQTTTTGTTDTESPVKRVDTNESPEKEIVEN